MSVRVVTPQDFGPWVGITTYTGSSNVQYKPGKYHSKKPPGLITVCTGEHLRIMMM